MRVPLLVLLFFIPFGCLAQSSGKTFATEALLKSLKESAKRRCMSGSPLRRCFSINQETCEMRVSSRLEICIRDQRIKLMGQNRIIELAAIEVEREVDACVNSEYYSLSQSSYKPIAGCLSLKSKGLANGAKIDNKSARRESQVYEDPLEGQRSIVDSYKLRLASDIRKVHEFKSELSSRKACPGYRGKDFSGCFKQGLAAMNIASATQIVELMAVGTFAALKDQEQGQSIGRERIVDNVLTILEGVDLHKFHLFTLKPGADVDREALVDLRKRDERALQIILSKTSDLLTPHVAENGGRLSRQPANTVDFKGRLDFQMKRDWTYPND